MSQIDLTWPDTNNELHVIIEGNNIQARSANNMGPTRAMILRSGDYTLPGNRNLKIFQAGSDLEYIPNACTDLEGNIYNAVRIGNITIMADYLNVTKYVDGENITYSSLFTTGGFNRPIRYPSSSVETLPSCYLYNQRTVVDAPGHGGLITGWHIPTYDELEEIRSTLTSNIAFSSDGSTSDSVARCVASKNGWNDQSGSLLGKNVYLNNITGLNLMPYGGKNPESSPNVNPSFFSMIWSDTPDTNSEYAEGYYKNYYALRLGYTSDTIYFTSFVRECAFPIRLIKNN